MTHYTCIPQIFGLGTPTLLKASVFIISINIQYTRN